MDNAAVLTASHPGAGRQPALYGLLTRALVGAFVPRPILNGGEMRPGLIPQTCARAACPNFTATKYCSERCERANRNKPGLSHHERITLLTAWGRPRTDAKGEQG